MTNTYGYNRKTPEEDEAIFAAVKRHHDAVAAKGYLVVMTSLFGSQNYDLDHANSDIDTFSFVYPSLNDIANAKEPCATMFELKDGHCEIKDIRLALNLLKKTSPNSAEYFISKYKIYNPVFAPILKEYLDDNTRMWNMVHCNYSHMITAIVGMSAQLSKRNLTAGKRFAHTLRMDNMYDAFMNSPNAGALLDLRPLGDRELALMAKLDTNTEHDIDYNNQCDIIIDKLYNYKLNFDINEKQLQTEQFGRALIDSLQWKLFKKYLEEANK